MTIANLIHRLDQFLHANNSFGHAFGKLERYTGVRRLYFAIGLLVLLGAYLVFGYASQFVANLVGFLYPAYASVKAIETHERADDTKWLMYWVVYAAFSVVEALAAVLLWWIPLYPFVKCAFLVYLMLPIQANGSVLLYNSVVRPFVLRHQERIDATLGRVQDAAGQFVSQVLVSRRPTAAKRTLS